MTRGQPAPIGSQIKLPSGYVNQKTEKGWKFVHHIVMEEHLGRPLEPNEWVYFTNKDADKSNPKVEDLEIRVVKVKDKKAEEPSFNRRPGYVLPTHKRRRLKEVLEELEELLSDDEEPDENAS